MLLGIFDNQSSYYRGEKGIYISGLRGKLALSSVYLQRIEMICVLRRAAKAKYFSPPPQ